MRRILAIAATALLSALGVLAAPAAPACACTCMPVADTQSRADVVVEATVLDAGRPNSTGPPITIRLAVERTLRGNVTGPEMSVLTSSSSAACGALFAPGRRYRVYASEQADGRLWTYLCSGNELLNPVRGPAVDEPAGPPRVAPRAATQPLDWVPLVAGPVIAGPALAALVWWRRRRAAAQVTG